MKVNPSGGMYRTHQSPPALPATTSLFGIARLGELSFSLRMVLPASLLVAALLELGHAPPVQAQSPTTWISNSSADFNTAGNWSAGVPPTTTSLTAARATFNGTGSQTSLTFATGIGGGNGTVGINGMLITGNQTSALSINSIGGASMRFTRNSTLEIQAGAGAFSIGTGGNTTFNFQPATSDEAATFTLVNNSASLATLGANATLNRGGNGPLTYFFDGTGDWNVLSGSANQGISIVKNGSGRLTLANAQSYQGTTTINTGALRIANANALGTTGSGTTVAGGTNTGRLELSGGIAFAAEPLTLAGRSNPSNDSPHLANSGGNNTWTGAITLSGGGSRYTVVSDDGTLSITGNISHALGSNRVLYLGGAADGVLTGALSTSNGTFEVIKEGAGRWELTSNANTYNGGTTVTAGTLLANNTSGSATGTGSVLVTGGMLGGTGRIGGSVTMNATGILKPGNSPGTLDINDTLTFNPGSTLSIELGGTTPGDGNLFYSQTNMTNAAASVVLGSNVALDVTLYGGFAPSLGDTFYVLTREDGGSFGSASFDGLTEGSLFSFAGYQAQITYQANWTGTQAGSSFTGGNDVAFVIVPEPAVYGLAACGAVLCWGLWKRRR